MRQAQVQKSAFSVFLAVFRRPIAPPHVQEQPPDAAAAKMCAKCHVVATNFEGFSGMNGVFLPPKPTEARKSRKCLNLPRVQLHAFDASHYGTPVRELHGRGDESRPAPCLYPTSRSGERRMDAPPAACTARLPYSIPAASARWTSWPSSHESMKPALKASPAPVVSMTGTSFAAM